MKKWCFNIITGLTVIVVGILCVMVYRENMSVRRYPNYETSYFEKLNLTFVTDMRRSDIEEQIGAPLSISGIVNYYDGFYIIYNVPPYDGSKDDVRIETIVIESSEYKFGDAQICVGTERAVVEKAYEGVWWDSYNTDRRHDVYWDTGIKIGYVYNINSQLVEEIILTPLYHTNS